MHRKPTILDVARLAAVSVGTVSHVLNASGRVSEQLRERVLGAVGELGYVPNKIAQGLRQGRSRLIGLCLPQTRSAYFAALVDAFESAAQEGFEIVQVLSHGDPALEARRIGALLAHQPAGVLIVPSHDPRRAFDLLDAAHVPTLVLDRPGTDPRFDYVTVDNRSAMTEAAEALLALGHRRLLFIANDPELVTTRQRIAALHVVARSAPVPVSVEIMRRGEDEAAFAQGLAARMQAPDAPTALIASNSVAALWMLQGLRPLGLRVPDKVSLLAFERPEWADILDPKLAAVALPVAEMAAIGWQRLLGRIEGDPTRRNIQVQARLLLAGSVGPAPRPTGV